MEKNPEFKRQCHEFMKDYIDRDHMSKVNVNNDSPSLIKYYLPYHAVMKEDSTTTKLRLVFNASSKTASGFSSNDMQCIGPTIQTDASSLLMTFRKHKYVVTADIGKMYRQFKIDPSQRSLQRILYRSSPAEEIQEYELNTVTYGTRSASFLATRCLKQLAIENLDKYPEAAEILENCTYMDDVFYGDDTIKGLKKKTLDLFKIMDSAKLDLRKFKSNCMEFIAWLPEEKREVRDDNQLHKALGVKGNTDVDTIHFSFHHMPATKISKRIALSEISKIFDPNGLLGPITFQFKCFMRTVHQLQSTWDNDLPVNFQEEWIDLAESSRAVNDIIIPRHAVIASATSIQLHGFSDASKLGYGACIYIRSENADGEVRVHLISSKSRLAGETQMPRLEVNGGVILAHMMSRIGNLLGITERYCWMDSLIALCWIKKQPANLKEFIANRIKEIQVTTANTNCIWRHVNTHQNPADIISRGMTAKEFKENPEKPIFGGIPLHF